VRSIEGSGSVDVAGRVDVEMVAGLSVAQRHFPRGHGAIDGAGGVRAAEGSEDGVLPPTGDMGNAGATVVDAP